MQYSRRDYHFSSEYLCRPSIPAASDPGLSSDPQAVFLLSPAVLFSEGPAVTAFVTDGGVACNRSAALPVVADPFSASTIVLPIDRDPTTYVNLILMKAFGPDSAVLFVEIFDALGAQVGNKSYEMTPDQPSLVIVDVLSQLGLGALQRGSIHVNAANRVSPTLFTAVATVVGVNGVQVVQGTRIVDFCSATRSRWTPLFMVRKPEMGRLTCAYSRLGVGQTTKASQALGPKPKISSTYARMEIKRCARPPVYCLETFMKRPTGLVSPCS